MLKDFAIEPVNRAAQKVNFSSELLSRNIGEPTKIMPYKKNGERTDFFLVGLLKSFEFTSSGLLILADYLDPDTKENHVVRLEVSNKGKGLLMANAHECSYVDVDIKGLVFKFKPTSN